MLDVKANSSTDKILKLLSEGKGKVHVKNPTALADKEDMPEPSPEAKLDYSNVLSNCLSSDLEAKDKLGK